MSLTEREKEIALECFDKLEISIRPKDAIAACDLFLSRIREEQDIFAYSTFDGEGGYDLRLHEGNESYQEEFSKRNPNYVNWVSPLFITPPAAPDCSELVEALSALLFHVKLHSDANFMWQDLIQISETALEHAKQMKVEE